MRKLNAGGMTNKLKAKARVTLSALDMKKLILTNIPYLFIFLFADRASCLYRASPGADMGNKLLYAMEHADRILTGFLPSFYYMDVNNEHSAGRERNAGEIIQENDGIPEKSRAGSQQKENEPAHDQKGVIAYDEQKRFF